MQISKNKRELIILVVLIVALAGFALYFYVIKPRNETITNLTKESSSLSTKSTAITRSVNNSASIDNELTQAKGEAMQYASIYLSGGPGNSDTYDKLKGIINTIFSDGVVTFSNGSQQNRYNGGTSTLKIDMNGETVPVYVYTIRFSYAFNNYQALMDSYANIADNYPYLYVKSYSITEGDAPYTAEIEIEVHELECNLESFKVGTCPCKLENGEICGHYNEFDADTCIYCHGSIDNCPNATCGALIELDNANVNVVTCPFCGTELKPCEYCHQYMLRDSDQCPKCDHVQD